MNSSLPSPFVASRKGHFITSAGSIFVIVVSLLVLAGWIFHVTVLKSFLPGLATMQFNAVFAGLALRCLGEEASGDAQRKVGFACVYVLLIVALLTLGENIFGWNLGVDQLFICDSGLGGQVVAPGRMLEATAICFLLSGVALLLIDFEMPHGFLLSQGLALASLAIALFALEGYVFGVWSLDHVFPFSAILFVILNFGIMWARPDKGLMAIIADNHAGGAMARRVLPWIVILTIALAWIRLEGQRAGFYNTGDRARHFCHQQYCRFESYRVVLGAVLKQAPSQNREANPAQCALCRDGRVVNRCGRGEKSVEHRHQLEPWGGALVWLQRIGNNRPAD